ncbi:MAG TPA: FGGY family carbohydrate kinase [Candidatus Binatia bacterium]|nr:FGGY family carbohydrate kinase [Candidatus Binatia bacterium]
MRQGAADLAVALDVGSTGVRALAVAADGEVRAQAYREVLPRCPAPGLVEHDPEAMLGAAVAVLGAVLAEARPGEVRGVGLATQRGTAAVWQAADGRAVAPVLSWQDGRTAARCRALMAEGVFVSPLAAASKIEWLLDRVDPQRAAVGAGRMRCGTLDAWLAWRLTGGRVYATDASNASCSGLYDLLAAGWSPTVAEALRVPLGALPPVVDSSGVLGRLDPGLGLPPLPLAALVGDQQAAMMGQLRLTPGAVKITYGTAAMLDLNAGPTPLWSMHGAYPLVLWRHAGETTYCLEGSAITAGAAVTWLRDGLGVIATPEESQTLAGSVPDAGGVWAVPAFQGLGTPYMDAGARAVVGGLTRASTRAHVVRALLEGVAWRCREVYEALRADSPHPPPTTLRADGGAARNDVLLQAQADALGLVVERPVVLQASALGAAYLAGLATGVWAGPDELARAWRRERAFEPRLPVTEREERFAAWRRHVPLARGGEP